MIEEIVPRETMEKFEIYFSLLQEWNRKTSLVQINTLKDFYERHVLDSLQLAEFIKDKTKKIVDLGTGAGFPGMILSIAGYENVTLIESNHRKTVFLQELSRLTNVSPVIINDRIENIKPEASFDFVLSRACAPLLTLLGYSSNFVSRETKGRCIFLKGEKVEDEINVAKNRWDFDYSIVKSKVNGGGWILLIKDLAIKG